MNRLDRLQAILLLLQSRKVIRAQDLADRFEVSIRSIYRDIRSLEEAGVPIVAEAGYGYSLVEGYQLPPLALTREEAAALLLGGKWLLAQGDRATGMAAESALNKLRAVLRYADKEFIHQLDQQTFFQKDSPVPNNTVRHDFLQTVQQALTGQRCLEIEYHSRYKGEETHRVLEPLGIYYFSTTWHLIAWCRLRQDYRDFRFDRIARWKLSEEPYQTRKYKTLEEFLQDRPEENPGTEIKIRISRKDAPYFAEQKYWMGLTHEEQEGDDLILHFLQSDLDYFGRWLLVWLDKVEIMAPDELKNLMKKKVQNLATRWS